MHIALHSNHLNTLQSGKNTLPSGALNGLSELNELSELGARHLQNHDAKHPTQLGLEPGAPCY